MHIRVVLAIEENPKAAFVSHKAELVGCWQRISARPQGTFNPCLNFRNRDSLKSNHIGASTTGLPIQARRTKCFSISIMDRRRRKS